MKLSDLDDDTRTGNVAKIHDRTASQHGDATAIRSADHSLTHAELRDESAAVAGGLHNHGLDPGDRILLFLPNCLEYLVGSLGAFKAGVVVSPVNPQYKMRELAYQLKDTGASAVLTHTALRPTLAAALAEIDWDPTVITVGGGDQATDVSFQAVDGDPVCVARADDDVVMLPYTSGTTGKPKGVELTHRNLRSQSFAALTNKNDTLDDEAVSSLVWLPLYHITGFTHAAWQALVRGGTLYLRRPADWEDSAAMALIESEKITHFVGVSAMYVDIVNHERFGEHDLSTLETSSEGGAKMPVPVQREFEDVAGIEMGEGYGLTETTGATHSQGGATFGYRHGTIGQPLRAVECRVVDETGEAVDIGGEGELLVRGPQVMQGYHNIPEATEAAFTDQGFFRTGDIARRDADNYYEIVGRKKHTIVSAGYNIYPSEVEELIREHNAIADVAVVGIPDKRRNAVPKAYLVPRPDIEPRVGVTADAIKQFCRDHLAEYKYPREVEFVDALPRTASGKVQKFKLEEGDSEDWTDSSAESD